MLLLELVESPFEYFAESADLGFGPLEVLGLMPMICFGMAQKQGPHIALALAAQSEVVGLERLSRDLVDQKVGLGDYLGRGERFLDVAIKELMPDETTGTVRSTRFEFGLSGRDEL